MGKCTSDRPENVVFLEVVANSHSCQENEVLSDESLVMVKRSGMIGLKRSGIFRYMVSWRVRRLRKQANLRAGHPVDK